MFICLVRDSLSPARRGVLEQVARACSPRVEPYGDEAVVCDGSGLTRVIGMPAVIAEEMRRMAWEREVGVRVAIAGTRTAAWLLGHVRPGTTIVAAGEERRQLDRLPLSSLKCLPPAWVPPRQVEETLLILARWGLATLGDFARLPRAEVLARLGAPGHRLHLAACGEDTTPLVPQAEARRFVERVELEWPVEGLEPLSFVLARVCDALSASLAAADRGAVSVTTRLTLVTKAAHVRTLTMPTPMRDSKTLRTLILLDLESHPAPAGIDVVEVECGVTPGRIVQGSLLSYPVPTPEHVSTLVARLQALAGDTHVGSPVVVDSHDPRAMTLTPFVPPKAVSTPTSSSRSDREPGLVLRRHRRPAPIRVRLDKGTPSEVYLSSMRPARVTSVSGPWRTSGQWWTGDTAAWDRDEWDVALDTGMLCRITRNRRTDQWELEGEMD